MNTTLKPRMGIKDRCRTVRKHIAKALVGQSVDLLTTEHTIVHGVVSGVLTEAGIPKLLVDGARYDLSQILTAMPATLDRTATEDCRPQSGAAMFSTFTYHLSTSH
jgi:hypothetical protein